MSQTGMQGKEVVDFDPSILQRSSQELYDDVRPIVVPSSSSKAVFRNWGQSFVSKPARVYAPTTVAQCATIVELARREGVQVRPVGRAHSPSDLALTKSWAIRMEGVKGILSIDPARPAVTALGGTYISDINEALDAASPRLALRNAGSISEQTIGGLISTATHGTGIEFPVVSTYAERLTILCPLPGGTQHLACSRKENAELFNATLCGLGSTGLITSVTVHVQPAFNLKQYSEELSFDSLFGAKTGYPVAVHSKQSLGKLLSENKRLPACPVHYKPSFRTKTSSDIYPISPSANAKADELSRADPQDDEETRKAQKDLENVVGSGQHVRMMWFPQVHMITMLRANRSTESASPTPSLISRLKGDLVGHRLTEFLLYVSRFNTQWTPAAVRCIHYLTHPAFPDDSLSQAAEVFHSSPQHVGPAQVAATTEAQAELPVALLSSDSTSTFSSPQTLVEEIGVVGPDGGEVSWTTEEFSASSPQLARDPPILPADTPAPRPLRSGNPVWSQVGRSDRIFNMDCLFPQYTDEWAIPFSRAAAAIRAMRDWLDEEEKAADGERIHFPVEIRFTDADGIWLSHAQGRKTCYIGIVQYRPYNRPVKYRQLFTKFETLMRHFAGRPHWAKAHTCSPAELSQLYPHWNDFLKTRQKYDPDQIFVNPYVERHLLGKVGEHVDSRVFKSRL